MIIDGKKIAEELYRQLEVRRRRIAAARLGAVVVGNDPVIDSFVRIKERAAKRLQVELEREALPATSTTEEVVAAVGRRVGKTDGIIVQLPLPRAVDADIVLAAIPPSHDVDGVGERPLVVPPVARAIAQILEEAHVDPAGKRAVVVGAGRLVGVPAAALLREKGASVFVLKKGDSLSMLKDADIVVSGAGAPGLITPEYLKEGVVLIDAGTSEQGGVLKGDADPACAGVARVFTPVPGGVGPVAVAMIFKNLFDLIESR